MESQLSGQKVSVIPYTRHSPGGLLLKNAAVQTMLGCTIQNLRNQPGYLTDSQRFRLREVESGQEKHINKKLMFYWLAKKRVFIVANQS
ncbi:hypothetical protein T4E_4642 [Trichinella pseudospiralis]|uniref:Uncharacterized protein n=1 Tax=Trichinella pseudospiralis TaxID=6337 RepID=A0A0V0YK79_TRIPS|nr:hypothetical protein T4E_4642 [Trichinella pseudospiralis]